MKKELLFLIFLTINCYALTAQTNSFQLVGYLTKTKHEIIMYGDNTDSTTIAKKDILKIEESGKDTFGFTNTSNVHIVTIKYGAKLQRGKEKVVINKEVFEKTNGGCPSCCATYPYCCSGYVSTCVSMSGCYPPENCYSCRLLYKGCSKNK